MHEEKGAECEVDDCTRRSRAPQTCVGHRCVHAHLGVWLLRRRGDRSFAGFLENTERERKSRLMKLGDLKTGLREQSAPHGVVDAWSWIPPARGAGVRTR